MGLKMTFAPQILPTWVPASSATQGNVNLLTKANGGLTNEFIDTTAPNYEPFYHATIVNAYSGGALNPSYGNYGAMMIFGGGHAATNDNSLTAMVFEQNSINFKRITDPSPTFDADSGLTEAEKKTLNSFGDYNYLSTSTDARGVSRVDGASASMIVDNKPAAPHSVGFLTVIPATNGGASQGTFFVPGVLAANRDLSIRTGSLTSYTVDITSTSTPSSAQNWNKKFTHPTYPSDINQTLDSYVDYFSSAVYDPVYNRVLYVGDNNYAQRWINPAATNANDWFVQGTGTGLSFTGVYVPATRFIYVPERDLFVFLYRKTADGMLGIKYAVNAAQPSWVNTGVTLSQNVELDTDWSSATWCPDIPNGGRLLVLDIKGNRSAYVEITIPTTLTDTWTVEQVNLSQTITTFKTTRQVDNSTIHGRLEYNRKTKSIVYYGAAGQTSATPDQVFVIRPRNV